MIEEELESLELPAQSEGYALELRGGRTVAVERRRDMLEPRARVRVFVSRMGDDIPLTVSDALDHIGAAGIIKPGSPVAIKVNLGGGIAGVPSSFSDPLVVDCLLYTSPSPRD